MSGNGLQDERNMEPRAAPDKCLRDEIVRLGKELEQARVALEDAHTEISVVTEECARQERYATAHQAARVRAEAAERLARERATGLATAATAQDADLNLRQMLEETSLLAEELREANDALLSANEQLDKR